MKKIVEYEIVLEPKAFEMVIEVNKLIKEGWQPLGGLSQEGFYIRQVMVKYE